MGLAERSRRTGFALRLEQGLGRLALSERRIADLFAVEDLQLALRELPTRLDMSAGVERFRHQRTQLERLVVSLEDSDLSRVLRNAAAQTGLRDLEVRALEGDLVFLGELAGEIAVPFLAKARMEPAGVGEERAVLLSFYEVRAYGPLEVPPPLLAMLLLDTLGLERFRIGPTAAVFDPVDRLLREISAELGWKAPDRREVRLKEIRCEAGRLVMCAERPTVGRMGPRSLEEAASLGAAGAKLRRFLADYEAKTLYSATESQMATGQLARAAATYERQLELHPDHPFITTRLLQLLVASPETQGDALALARHWLSRTPDDPDGLCALAAVQWRRGQRLKAADTLALLADSAERRGDALEAAQARCGVAAASSADLPERAIEALQAALSIRRRLPGALRALADLHVRTGNWPSALEAREGLLATLTEPAERRDLLVELGRLALGSINDVDRAISFFEQALAADSDHGPTLLALAEAQERAGRLLPAVRTLDRVAARLQSTGDTRGAAAVLVRLGDLWQRIPEGGSATALLRYRQALLLEPERIEALVGLATSSASEGHPEHARQHLEEALRLASKHPELNVDIPGLHLALGRLAAGPLGDELGAVIHLQKSLVGTDAQASEALGLLEGIYRRAGRFEDVSRVLQAAVDRASGAAERAELLVRLAELLRDRLGDQERARRLLEDADSLRPSHGPTMEALAELHRQLGRYSELVQVLARLVRVETSPKRLAERYAEQGELLKKRLNRSAEAAGAFALALGVEPGHRGALLGLADLYREQERFSELAPLLERLAKSTSDRREAALVWLELGRLESGPLERPESAVNSLTRALEGLPDDSEVLKRLGELHVDAGRPAKARPYLTKLHTLYEQEGYDEPKVPFLLRLAKVQDACGETASALALVESAALAAPDERALYELAQDLLLKDGQVQRIVAFFEQGLARARTPEVKVFLAKRAGRLLWRQLKRPADAAPVLDLALSLEPDDRDLCAVRLEVATAQAEWPRVAELLRAQLHRAEPSERPALLTRLAKLAYAELKRPDEGAELALAALEAQPSYVPALTLVGEKAFEAGDYLQARTAYEALVAGDARPEDRLRLGVAELKTGLLSRAKERLCALYSEGLRTGEVIAALAEACLQQGDAILLSELLASRSLAFGRDEEGRFSFLKRAAAVLTASPVTREQGRACWQELAELRPTDLDVLAALAPERSEPAEPEGVESSLNEQKLDEPTLDERDEATDPEPSSLFTDGLSSQSDVFSRFSPDDDELPPLPSRSSVEEDTDQQARADELMAAAKSAASPSDAARAWLALAEHQRDRLHDPSGAIPALERVLELAQAGGPEWSEAMEALEDLHALSSDWSLLLALYERRLSAGVGDAAEVHLLRASILRAAGRLDEALVAAEAALPVGERAKDLLVNLLAEAGRPGCAAERLLDGVDLLSAEAAAYTRWRAAELLAGVSPQEALRLLAAAWPVLEDPMLVEQWLNAARRHGEHESLAEALVAKASLLNRGDADAVRRSGLLLEAAALVNEPSQARAHLEGALLAWPDNIDALEQLNDLLVKLGDDEGRLPLLARIIEAALPGPYRGERALELAQVAKRHGELEKARRAAQVALDDLDGEQAEVALAIVVELESSPN